MCSEGFIAISYLNYPLQYSTNFHMVVKALKLSSELDFGCSTANFHMVVKVHYVETVDSFSCSTARFLMVVKDVPI